MATAPNKVNPIKLKKNYAEGYADLGRLLQNAGDIKNALNYYEISLKYNPNLFGAYLNKGNIFAKLGSHKAETGQLGTDTKTGGHQNVVARAQRRRAECPRASAKNPGCGLPQPHALLGARRARDRQLPGQCVRQAWWRAQKKPRCRACARIQRGVDPFRVIDLGGLAGPH